MRLRFEAVVTIAIISLSGCAQRAVLIPQPDTGEGAQAFSASRSLARGVQNGDLMYVSDPTDGKVVMYTYPQGRIVTTLTQMAHPRGECVDSSQNLYITNYDASYNGNIYVFAHGAYNPTTVLNFPDAHAPNACSVDPTTGNLAAANSTVQIEVYDPVTKSWSGYINVYLSISAVAYDSAGNLFVGGRSGSQGHFLLAEIPSNGSCFCNISLSGTIGGSGDTDYTLQWDGTYLAVTDISSARRIVVYRISVSGTSGTIVNTIWLHKNRKDLFGTGYSWIHGNSILAPNKSGASVASWRYPEGGKPKKNTKLVGYQFAGITVSNGL
jgi:hypothetical protein